LEQQGLIETVRGKGTYIAGIPEGKSMRDEGVIKKVKEELRQQCMELMYQGMEKEEIVHLIEEILKGLQGGDNL
jgi:DNA-binding transcriptional regulator YhcF (GntR family)